MFVKVVASPSKTAAKIAQKSAGVSASRSTSGSFGGTPSAIVRHPKRSVVSSSSQIKFTALAQMTELQARKSKESSHEDGLRCAEARMDTLLPPPTFVIKSESLSSLRRAGRRMRKNYCCVALFFLISGLLCNGISYWISVQTAQLNAEIVEAAVANHDAVKFNLKKAMVVGPSKYLIGFCSFIGRVTSAVGTFFLAQAIVTWLQKQRSTALRSAAGHADNAVTEIHGGCGEIVADCWTQCVPAFG